MRTDSNGDRWWSIGEWLIRDPKNFPVHGPEIDPKYQSYYLADGVEQPSLFSEEEDNDE